MANQLSRRRLQKVLVKFLIKYPRKWHTFATDYKTVSVVCASANLGILKVNEFNQMILISAEKANRWLNA